MTSPSIEKAKGLPLIETAPRVDGDEICCGHCAHLRSGGRAVDQPVAGQRYPGTLNLSELYDCALHAGQVYADNTCASFARRRRVGA